MDDDPDHHVKLVREAPSWRPCSPKRITEISGEPENCGKDVNMISVIRFAWQHPTAAAILALAVAAAFWWATRRSAEDGGT